MKLIITALIFSSMAFAGIDIVDQKEIGLKNYKSCKMVIWIDSKTSIPYLSRISSSLADSEKKLSSKKMAKTLTRYSRLISLKSFLPFKQGKEGISITKLEFDQKSNNINFAIKNEKNVEEHFKYSLTSTPYLDKSTSSCFIKYVAPVVEVIEKKTQK